ncbi:MAG TPA: glycosyltransferase family 39 protein, partial [Roseococcus sp.]|nr:glycosyltransferase family 39 protein [Roseococcus sp.]
AHIAKTDAALLASVAGAMGLLGAAYLNPSGFTARRAAAFWAILGIGVLLKGPIAPMVALLAGVTLLIADRGRAPWLRPLRPAWGVPLTLAIVLPWMVAIGLATEGRFFAQAIGDDMLAKVGSGDEKHWGPPGYYLVTFLVAAFPAGVIAVLAAPAIWAERALPRTRFLLAWIVPTWLLFEAVATKLPHYTLPTYPAIMLLAAAWAMDPLRPAPPRWLALGARLAVAAVAVGLALVAALVPWFVTGQEPWWALLALPCAALLVALVWRAMRRADWARAAMLGVAAAIPLYASLMQLTFPRLDAIWIAPRLQAAVARAAPNLPPSLFGITGHAEPSTLFALGAEVRFLRRGEDAARFLQAGPGRLVAVGHRALDDFRREAAALSLAPRPAGVVAGFNYTRGRAVTLHLFQVD